MKLGSTKSLSQLAPSKASFTLHPTVNLPRQSRHFELTLGGAPRQPTQDASRCVSSSVASSAGKNDSTRSS